ncbi:MAG: hypothetical protein WC865_03835 [Bacteroidales bacterium]
MNWLTILEQLGIVGLFSGALALICRKFIDTYFEKKQKLYEVDIENRKELYKHDLSQSLEHFKSELRIQFEKSIKLHERRFEIATNLSERILELDSDMSWMTNLWREGPLEEMAADDIARIKKAADSYNAFVRAYQPYRFLFSPDLCALMDSIRDAYHESYISYTIAKKFEGFETPEIGMMAIKASKIVKHQIPELSHLLEGELRNLIEN